MTAERFNNPVTVIYKSSVLFKVPANTRLPFLLEAGNILPVIMPSLTALVPLATRPSHGIRSPGRTKIKSSGRNSRANTLYCFRSRRTRADLGKKSSNFLIKTWVRSFFNTSRRITHNANTVSRAHSPYKFSGNPAIGRAVKVLSREYANAAETDRLTKHAKLIRPEAASCNAAR